MDSTVLMGSELMEKTMTRLAREIVDDNQDLSNLVLLGILRRGRPLADRLAGMIGALTGTTPPVGSLSTALYRDDAHAGVKFKGHTHFEFNVDGRTVLLVDDVLAAGRTIRAAMDEVMDYGRPQRIQLACLVDRGGRELPIQADYLGYSASAPSRDWIAVHLTEIDGEDAVLQEQRDPETHG